MTHRTFIISDITEYLACEHDSEGERAEQFERRNERLFRFPYSVMLQVAFPELDFINRWCWLHFGPRDGECMQSHSEYRVCDEGNSHAHEGMWTDHWFTKTEYDFGFNVWYFVNRLDFDGFMRQIPSFNWGEHYSK